MESSKPFRTIEEQLKILEKRNLTINDKQQAIDILKYKNYYRLSAYSLTLRKNDRFYDGVTFDNIVELYNFDNELRRIVMKYTPYIEIAFRTHIAYHHSEKYGPLGYLDNNNFENQWLHAIFINKLSSLINKSHDVFIQHHKDDLNGVYPFWVVIEVTTFDVISKLFKNLLKEDRNRISNTYYDMSREYIESWLHSAVIARNISAHGGRFYNRTNLQRVKIDSKLRNTINSSTPFAYIFAIFKLLPNNSLRCELIRNIDALFTMYPYALKKHVGFPEEWKDVLEEQMPAEKSG